eukprot:EC687589.1.p2 GENE.EC687589.1~~EC687589.1.p2  ORF type:complete len:188 (+),score=100.27 EC687589.1:130-693(+)
MGRKKIEISFIADRKARLSCFRKRRAGLFKKCEELALLTGCRVLLAVLDERDRFFRVANVAPDVLLRHCAIEHKAPLANDAPVVSEGAYRGPVLEPRPLVRSSRCSFAADGDGEADDEEEDEEEEDEDEEDDEMMLLDPSSSSSSSSPSSSSPASPSSSCSSLFRAIEIVSSSPVFDVHDDDECALR